MVRHDLAFFLHFYVQNNKNSTRKKKKRGAGEKREKEIQKWSYSGERGNKNVDRLDYYYYTLFLMIFAVKYWALLFKFSHFHKYNNFELLPR